ncbi:hypothetical protein AB0L65_35785 [Nonomuraea sp. NPDC052116]|uniref:hypothetical protein n=1 Tax=Nonomuraea sp. NPDC052116 TaxID=3155665 RepID=UPI0034166AB4
MFFATLGGFAEMKRDMMIERTDDGLAQAAAETPNEPRASARSSIRARRATSSRAPGVAGVSSFPAG